jgi:CHAD domain-containing protein
MEPSHLQQSNVATPPPPGAALGAILESPTSISPLFPMPRLPQRTGNVSGRLTGTATIRLGFPARPVPVAVGPILAAALDSRWQSYRAQLRLCQEKFSEEAVHELRVATRRLLAQFTLLSCIAPSTALEKVRRILKRRLAALGDLRDAQVQRLFIEQKTASFPELVLLRGWLQRRERRLARSAAEKVSRFKTRKLERWISALTGDLIANARRSRAQSQLASAVMHAAAQAFGEAVERRRAIDLADLRTIHQTRVAFKRFRYMLESLSPGVTGLSKRQLRALAYYQRKMGIIQDLEVMQTYVARYTREDRRREALLQRFSGHLRQRRARALRSFLRSADRLFEFWPPATLAARGDSVPTQNAA